MKNIRFIPRKQIVGRRALAWLVLTLSLCAQAEPVSQVYKGIKQDSFYDICFRGEKGLVVGNNSVVLQSLDGGENWTPISVTSDSIAMLGVACRESGSVIVGQEGRIYVEENGGWSQVDSGTDARLLSVAMSDSGLGFATGGFGTVLRTKDSGATWSLLPIDWEATIEDFQEPHIYDVAVSNAGIVTLVGEFGLVLQSEDSGDSWHAVRKEHASLFAIHFADNSLGYAVGQDGEIIRTEDGGRSWVSIEANSSGNLLGVWSSYQGEVLITGIRTMLRSHDDGNTWESLVSDGIATGWYAGVAEALVHQSPSVHTEDDVADVVYAKVFAAGNYGEIIEILE